MVFRQIVPAFLIHQQPADEFHHRLGDDFRKISHILSHFSLSLLQMSEIFCIFAVWFGIEWEVCFGKDRKSVSGRIGYLFGKGKHT